MPFLLFYPLPYQILLPLNRKIYTLSIQHECFLKNVSFSCPNPWKVTMASQTFNICLQQNITFTDTQLQRWFWLVVAFFVWLFLFCRTIAHSVKILSSNIKHDLEKSRGVGNFSVFTHIVFVLCCSSVLMSQDFVFFLTFLFLLENFLKPFWIDLLVRNPVSFPSSETILIHHSWGIFIWL